MASDSKSWKCSVCGHISETDTAPEKCPVCGVPQEKFNELTAVKPVRETPDYYRCMVCNYTSDEKPSQCPVCGVDSENFESVLESFESNLLDEKNRIVIIGAGVAGLTAAEEIRAISPSAEIVLLTKEKNIPYYRLNLTRYIAGEVTGDFLSVHPESWYTKNNIRLLTESEVVDINPEQKNVRLAGGETFKYDKLIITAGSHPFTPPVEGAELNGVTTLRFLEDADYILSQAEIVESVVIIGGGVLGLEAAGALKARNADLNVTVVEGFDYLMPRQLNEKAASCLTEHLSSLGINVITNTSVTKITGSTKVESLETGNGEKLSADLVIFSVGVRPNRYLAGYCDILVNNGVIVNDNMETSVSDIYAAGDIAEHRGVLYGLWNAATKQGKIAGSNAAGVKAEFSGISRSNTLKVLDVNLFSIGNFAPCDGSCTIVEEENKDSYSYVLFRDGKIEGAVFYGDTTKSSLIKTAIEQKISFPVSIIQKNNINDVAGFISSNSF